MEHITRVVIADDHPIFRDGLAKAIQLDPHFAVVGQACDGIEAVRLISDVRPDVAVLDVSMPGMDGLEVARQLHRNATPTEIVILTMYKELSYFDAAINLGVRGYLLKDSATTDVLACLRAVDLGQHYVSPIIAHLLIERKKQADALEASTPALDRLTPAERAILKLIAQNLTSKEISGRLFVSTRTVENHRMHICQKLGIRGHNKLFEFAFEHRSAL